MTRIQLSLLIASTLASVALVGCSYSSEPASIAYESANRQVPTEPEAVAETEADFVSADDAEEGGVSSPRPKSSARPKPDASGSSPLLLIRGGEASAGPQIAAGSTSSTPSTSCSKATPGSKLMVFCGLARKTR